MKALEGIRVLDLTRALAGPFCTLMLGDYGADVVKIEIPGAGDDTRKWGPPFIGEESAYFLSINRNKRSLTLNFKEEKAREIFLKLAKDADVVVVLEADVPWATPGSAPSSDTRIIGIGEDPLFSNYPVRGFHVDHNLAGSPRLTLRALINAVKAIGVDSAAVQARKDKLSSSSKSRREAALERAEKAKNETPISKAWFSRCLSDILDENTIVLSELGVDLSQMDFNHPGSFFGSPPSSGLGWALGASLGSKLAAPEKTVICCVGDGSYIFGSGTAAHIVSQAQNLPVLNIVWNNGIWNAVQSATKVTYADGYAVRNNDFAVSTLSQSFQYELICQAAGGYAERVDDPSQVPEAIQRALHAVKVEKRQALLNIIGQ